MNSLPAVKSDNLTVLKTMRGMRMTKLWQTDGTIKDYESAKNFLVKSARVSSITTLHRFLTSIEGDTDTCIIRGAFVGESAALSISPPEFPGHYRRQNTLFHDHPLHALCIDIDGYLPLAADPVTEPVEAIDAYISEHLPESFQGASYHWQLSSSAGSAKNRNILKAHVWFWLSVPRTCAEMKRWSKGIGAVIDSSLFQQVQAHYTASPVFEAGVVNPVPVRSGLVTGVIGDDVDLELPDAPLGGAKGAAVSMSFDDEDANAGNNIQLADPRMKRGVIGQFCRAFSIEDVIERFLSLQYEFEEGSDRRLTYKFGGGATGGAFVTSDREHVVSRHNTDPCDNRATNKFDLVRVHLYGHLDIGVDAAALRMGTRPSYVAMTEMVEGLLEIKAATHEAHAASTNHWGDKIAAAETTTELQRVAEGEIAHDSTLSVADRAILTETLKKRFRDMGAALPVAEVRKLIKPKTTRALPDLSAEGRPLETLDNMVAVCSNEEIVIRYNVIKKEDEILVPNTSWSIDNRREATIASLRSILHKNEVPTRHLKGWVTNIADANQFNPAAQWVTSKPWDGVSRLQAFYDTVAEDPSICDRSTKEMILRVWAISAIAAIMNADGVAARGVLVFQGTQYSGKTRWIEALAPKDLELVKTGCSLNVHDKDSVKQILSSWISELGELDSTFKRSDIAGLKAFITKDRDELRRPFAQAESQFGRRTVFAASVNDDQFLHDDTGNTRFWVIPIVSIEHSHELDMQQVWAEFYVMRQAGAIHYMTQPEMALITRHNEEFEPMGPIAELISTHLDWSNFDVNVNYQEMSITDMLIWLGVQYPKIQDVTIAGKHVRKLTGRKGRRTGKVRLQRIPKHKIEIDQFFDLSVAASASPATLK